jgi:hypothetical protein
MKKALNNNENARRMGAVGIADVDLKISILSTLTGQYKRRDLVVHLLGNMDSRNKYVTDASKLLDSLISYRQGRKKMASSPFKGDNGTTIIHMVCDYMRSIGCTATDLEEILVFGTVEEFAACFTGDYRNRAFRVVHESSISREDPTDIVQIDDHREKEPGTLRESFQSGFLTQRLIYVTPDAVELWKGVYNHPDYLQPVHCLEAHRALFSSEFWIEHLREKGTNSLISLGAGSYKKDVMAIKYADQHLPKNIHRLNYTIVDYSHRMLSDTVSHVRDAVATMPLNRNVEVYATRRDFMKLTSGSTHRSLQSSAAFFCFGGTIGNVSEGSLLNHIRNIAQPGDLFVVGMETVGDEVQSPAGQSAFRRRMNEKYNNRHMRAFLRPALDALWPYLKGAGDIDAVQEALYPNVAFGDDSLHSDIPGSASAYWRVNWKHENASGKVVLLSSTRYNVESFRAFANSRRFDVVEKFASNSNPNYIALVLQYIGEPEDDEYSTADD